VYLVSLGNLDGKNVKMEPTGERLSVHRGKRHRTASKPAEISLRGPSWPLWLRPFWHYNLRCASRAAVVAHA